MAQKPDNTFLVWAIIASQFGPPFMFSGVAVALPAMGIDLAAGATSLSLVETLLLAGSLSFVLPVGRLADAGDKNTLYKLGILGFGITSILIACLSWMPAILFVRFLQGVSAALFAATGTAVLADIVPAERRGRAFGCSMATAYLGLTMGPIIAGFLVDAWGWRAVFVTGGVTIFAGLAIVQWKLPSTWQLSPGVLHVPSVCLVVAAVLCLVFGSATLGEGALGIVLLVIGTALAILFVHVQHRVKNPILDFDELMANSILKKALLVQMLLYTNAFCTTFMFSIYLQIVLNHPAPRAGQILAVSSIVMVVFAPLAGRLSDRFRGSLVTTSGVACMLVSCVMAVLLSSESSLGEVMVVLALQGLGFAMFTAPNMATIMNSVSSERVGMASALGAKSRSIGMVSGMLIIAVLISVKIGNNPVEQHAVEFMQLMRIGFMILSGLTAVALAVCSLGRVNRVSDSV